MMSNLEDDKQIATGVSPNYLAIDCYDCVLRDKTCIEIDGKLKPVGTTRAFCDVYKKLNGKPYEVLFGGEPCEFKETEEIFADAMKGSTQSAEET